MNTDHRPNAYLLGFLAGTRLKLTPMTPDEAGYPVNPYSAGESANAAWDKGFMDAILERGPLSKLSMVALQSLPDDHPTIKDEP
ncbi:MAG TPA: hypothetical protein VGN07_17520 [Steroidobacteraceae bacterium]